MATPLERGPWCLVRETVKLMVVSLLKMSGECVPCSTHESETHTHNFSARHTSLRTTTAAIVAAKTQGTIPETRGRLYRHQQPGSHGEGPHPEPPYPHHEKTQRVLSLLFAIANSSRPYARHRQEQQVELIAHNASRKHMQHVSMEMLELTSFKVLTSRSTTSGLGALAMLPGCAIPHSHGRALSATTALAADTLDLHIPPPPPRFCIIWLLFP